MYEHAVVNATWAESPIYCRIVPWAERILGMSRAEAMAQRDRYARGEVWCMCVSDVYPDGFEASIDVASMRSITVAEFDEARRSCARSATKAESETVALPGRGRRLNLRRRRAAVAG